MQWFHKFCFEILEFFPERDQRFLAVLHFDDQCRMARDEPLCKLIDLLNMETGIDEIAGKSSSCPANHPHPATSRCLDWSPAILQRAAGPGRVQRHAANALLAYRRW